MTVAQSRYLIDVRTSIFTPSCIKLKNRRLRGGSSRHALSPTIRSYVPGALPKHHFDNGRIDAFLRSLSLLRLRSRYFHCHCGSAQDAFSCFTAAGDGKCQEHARVRTGSDHACIKTKRAAAFLVSSDAASITLGEGPKPFRLLDTEIVLWLTSKGMPAAHRRSLLPSGPPGCRGATVKVTVSSAGIMAGNMATDGRVLRVPQVSVEQDHRNNMSTPALSSARTLWICLGGAG